jgi:cellulose biosynthesis protein BcsQ
MNIYPDAKSTKNCKSSAKMVTSNSISERVLAELRGRERPSEAWWNVMAGVQIRKRVDLAKAWHEGKSIFSYNPRCDVIESYRKLADFVCQVSR